VGPEISAGGFENESFDFRVDRGAGIW
jgi:hypothetical protein